MCTPATAQYILDALSARIKNLSVFTAKDVTDDARDAVDFKDANIKHTDVRRIVHEEFDTQQFPPEYNREQFLALSNGHTAICYYPNGKAACDHPNAQFPTIKVPIAANLTVSPSQVVKAPKQGGHTKDGDGYICQPTAEGRINIPKDLFAKVTPNGSSYDITCNGSVIYRTPNKDGRVRVHQSELGGGSKYRVSVNVTANTIVVEQV